MPASVWWFGCMALSGVAALGLLALLIVYSRHLREAPSPFGRGLVAFAGLFFLEAAGSIAVWSNLSREYDEGVAIPMMTLRALEVAGVGALLWVSWE